MRPLSSSESEDPRVVLVSMEKLMQIQKVLSKTHSQVYRGDIGVTLVYMKGQCPESVVLKQNYPQVNLKSGVKGQFEITPSGFVYKPRKYQPG